MEAIILAGGFGTRLRSVVSEVPKPMAPICGKPFLEILLKWLAERKFQRVVLSVGYKHHVIVSHFGNDFMGVQIEYSVEQSPLGTGGGIKQALAKCRSEQVYIFNGDTFFDFDFTKCLAQQRKADSICVGVRVVDDTNRYGRVTIDDGRITAIDEKGTRGQGYVNAGFYIIPRRSMDNFEVGEVFSLESQFLPQQIKALNVFGFVSQGLFIDIGVPSDYQRAQTVLSYLV